MSFLDNLLTLENPLHKGTQILTFPRSLRTYLFGPDKPFCYKAHQTKAGLYLVLPHTKKGSVFLNYPHEGFTETKNFHHPHTYLDSFYVEQTMTKREKRLSFASQVSKVIVHPETQTNLKISVSYGMAEEGKPFRLRLHYTLLFEQGHYKMVLFDIYRNQGTKQIMARGPEIKTNMTRKDFFPVDYEATLENLVNLITMPEIGPEQFSLLLTDSYVALHTLH